MKYIFETEEQDFITALVNEGWTKTIVVEKVKEKFGWGRSKSYEVVTHLFSDYQWSKNQKKDSETVKALNAITQATGNVTQSLVQLNEVFEKLTPAPTVNKTLEFKDQYVYNKDTDSYVFTGVKGYSTGNVVLSGDTVRLIQHDYTEGKLQAHTLAAKYSIPKGVMTEIIQKLGIHHGSCPITKEDLVEKSVEDLAKEALARKDLEVRTAIERLAWQKTVDNAQKWAQFSANKLEPFEALLKTWTPPSYVPILQTTNKTPKKQGRVFVAGAFDWHFGGRAEKRYLSKGKDWNVEAANKAVDNYLSQIRTHVTSDAIGYESATVLLGGDLYNSLTGFTANGTPMNNEFSRDTQFDSVFNALVKFVSNFLELFPSVHVEFVRGNHGGTTDYPLAVALQAYFRTEPRLKFVVNSKRTAAVKINSTLLLLDHGASDQAKSMMPREGSKKEVAIQHMILNALEQYPGVKWKQKIFAMGDLHHYRQQEFGDFEFVQFGALPCGDQYSDAKGLHNRPRQNCLVIDDTGLSQVLHFYFD